MINFSSFSEMVRYKRIQLWFTTHERVLMPVMLIFGLLVDSFTFKNIDISIAFSLLLVYLVISGMCILFMNAFDSFAISHERPIFQYIRLMCPLVIQFAFGAILSAVFIFYFFSGSLFVSWPFALLLIFLMISNDLFRRYYSRAGVQLGVYFFIVFAIFSIILPFVFRSIHFSLFLISGAAALAVIYGFAHALFRVAPLARKHAVHYASAILTIVLCLNIMYFLNIIPPIPLSLRESVVAHDLTRKSGDYVLVVEKQNLWERFLPGQTIFRTNDGKVVVFTAIFAPKNLNAKIVHEWSFYDETKKAWIKKDRLSFSLSGGRMGGFRGYSMKSKVDAGKWKVDVKTERGQVVGRVVFQVKEFDETVKMEKVVK